MAIKLPQGFKIGSIEPIDSRITLTKAEMYNVNENTIPANYFCICKDDGKVYIFNKTFEKIETTGKFRPYEEVLNMAQAILKAMSTPESAQEIADAMFDSEHFQTTIDNKIDLAISQIQAVDGNEEE